MANSFQKAKKSSVYLKLAIAGPSGSGKTTAALKMARGLVGKKGKIALLTVCKNETWCFTRCLQGAWVQ